MEEKVVVKRIKMPSSLVTNILLLIVGLVLLLQPGESLNLLCRILGAIIMVAGIVEIVIGINGRATFTGTANIGFGAIITILGLMIVTRPDMLVSLLPFVAGVVITVNAVTSLIKSCQLISGRDKYWWVGILFSIVGIGFGLLLFFRSYEAAEFTARIVGLFLIYTGASHLWISYRKARTIKIREQEEAALDVEAKIIDM